MIIISDAIVSRMDGIVEVEDGRAIVTPDASHFGPCEFKLEVDDILIHCEAYNATKARKHIDYMLETYMEIKCTRLRYLCRRAGLPVTEENLAMIFQNLELLK